MQQRRSQVVSLQRAVLITLPLLMLLLACQSFSTQRPVAQPAAAPNDAAKPHAGSLTFGVANEPDTLDPHKTAQSIADQILSLIGASLVALDERGQVVPYLAERWDTSVDGRVWTFYLRRGVTFHDGTPFSAYDYAATFQRALDPRTASLVAGSLLGNGTRVAATDDYTLVLTLQQPFFPLLSNLASAGYLMPLSRATLQTNGLDAGHHPVSVGPYRFKSWRSGEAVVLERNPAFAWGPRFAPTRSPTVEQIVFRFLPQADTRLAALEVGEVDITDVPVPSVARLRAARHWHIYETPLAGAAPLGVFNQRVPPFDDLRVRQALNLALDRPRLLQAAVQGYGLVQYGPLSASVRGYWPGVEQLGYQYDPRRAQALLAQAGYTMGSAGLLTRDGQPLRFALLTTATYARDATVLQAQWRALGIDAQIVTVEAGTLGAQLVAGDYQLALLEAYHDEADLLYLLYHSQGTLRLGQLDDVQLDQLLGQTRALIDPAQRQEAVDQVQARIVAQAYALPLYTPLRFTAVSPRISDVVVRSNGDLLFDNVALVGRP